jgi:hypothetical protein
VAHGNRVPLGFEVFFGKRTKGKIVVNEEKVHGGDWWSGDWWIGGVVIGGVVIGDWWIDDWWSG